MHHEADDFLQFVWICIRQRWNYFGPLLMIDLKDIDPLIWQLQGAELIDGDTQRPHIMWVSIWTVTQHFWARVERSTRQLSFHTACCVSWNVQIAQFEFYVLILQQFHILLTCINIDLAGHVEKNIGRFDIPVDDALGVNMLNRRQHLYETSPD